MASKSAKANENSVSCFTLTQQKSMTHRKKECSAVIFISGYCCWFSPTINITQKSFTTEHKDGEGKGKGKGSHRIKKIA